MLLAIVVTAANVTDRTGARLVAGQLRGRFPRLVTLFADAGYSGPALAMWLLSLGGWVLESVRGAVGKTSFEVEPKRWISERTLGWLNYYRRLGKDDEELPETSEVMLLIAMSHLMVKRLHQ